MKKIILPVIAFGAIMMTSCGESGPSETEVETAVTEMKTTLEETEAMDEEINTINREEEETEELFEDLNN